MCTVQQYAHNFGGQTSNAETMRKAKDSNPKIAVSKQVIDNQSNQRPYKYRSKRCPPDHPGSQFRQNLKMTVRFHRSATDKVKLHIHNPIFFKHSINV